jgi:hypothetical protein
LEDSRSITEREYWLFLRLYNALMTAETI